jgi:uncharacterized membrane protein YcfT
MDFEYFVSQLPGVVPTVLVCVVGMIFAAIKASSYPKPAQFVLGALGLMLVNTLVTSVLFSVLVRLQVERSARPSAIGFSLLNFFSSALGVVSIGLLVAAAFVDRERSPQSYPQNRPL